MNKISLSLALVLMAFSGSLAAKTLVTVNGTKIDSSEIDLHVKNLQTQSQGKVQDTPQLRQKITQEMVTRTLIKQEARRLKIDQSAEYKKITDQALTQAKKEGADKRAAFKSDWSIFQNEMLVQAFIADIVRRNPVTEADVKKTYDDINQFYKNSDEVQLGEIITSTSTDAEKASTELKAKKSFKNVAIQYSTVPLVKQTGGINNGYISLKDLEKNEPVVYSAISSLKKGQYTTKPILGNNFAAVFYISDKRVMNVPPFEELAPSLNQRIQSYRIDTAIMPLYEKAKIESSK